jgi:hypothetical protein
MTYLIENKAPRPILIDQSMLVSNFILCRGRLGCGPSIVARDCDENCSSRHSQDWVLLVEGLEEFGGLGEVGIRRADGFGVHGFEGFFGGDAV